MRSQSRLPIIFCVSLGALGCYDAGDLGNDPFLCSPSLPDCPDNYICACGPMCTDASGNVPPTISYKNPSHDPNRSGTFYCMRISDIGTVGDGAMLTTGLAIPKSMPYPSAYTPLVPALSDSNWPDQGLEPNNAIAQATGNFDNGVAYGNPPEKPLAIYPAGDIDVFAVNANNEFVKVTLAYVAAHGDIGVALFDASGAMLPGTSNKDDLGDGACVASGKALTGDYYVVIVGEKNAQGMDSVNTYTLEIDKSATPPAACALPSQADMSEGADAGADL